MAEKKRLRAVGFTLVETLVTTVVMVIVFALLAVIFGRAATIHQVVRRGGDAENLAVSLLNTMLYGPGIERSQGLVGTTRVYHPADDFFAGFNPDVFAVDDHLYLAFEPADPPGGPPVIYRLAVSPGEGMTLLRARNVPPGQAPDFENPAHFVDLKPPWAADQELEILPGSHFAFCSSLGSAGCEPAATADKIRYVLIHLEVKSAFQPVEETIVLRRFVRVRNVPPPF